jgi:thiol-disulfide isomerase/thioredoxin
MRPTTLPGWRGFVAALIAAVPSGAAMAGSEQPLRAAHPFAYVDINPSSETHGQRLPLPVLYAERGLVLNFIASWCSPCWQEIPELQEFGNGSPTPLVFVAADEHGPTSDVLRLADRAGIRRPILHVPKDEIAGMESHYDHEMLPSTYLIDREGRIVQVFQGVVEGQRLSEAATTLLPAAEPSGG